MSKWKSFLQRKNIRPSAKLYFIDAMGSMALGLFATLLIGTIFDTLGQYTGLAMLAEIAGYAKGCTGAALGVAIAYTLQAPPLVMLSGAVAGMIGNGLGATFMLGGAEKALTAGDVMICPPGTGHGVANNGQEVAEICAVIVYA